MGRLHHEAPVADGSTISDAMSFYTQRSEDEMNDTPPAYSDASNPAVDPSLNRLAGSGSKSPLDRPPFRQYDELELFMDARFDSDPVYAEQMVREWSAVPAAQVIHIRGTHVDESLGATKSDKTVVDFDIQIPLVDYLVDHWRKNPWSEMKVVENEEKTYRGGIFKSTGPTRPQAQDAEAQLGSYPKLSLTAWMHLFCASHAQFKCFRIQRSVSGLDTKFIHDSLQSLISGTNYRGHTRITFPITNRFTEVHNATRVNTWRFNNWIRFFFYLTFLWLIVWPYLFFSTRKWAVVVVDWPWSVTDEYGVKTYAQISEAEWLARWKGLIEKSVLDKKKGTLTTQDLVAFETPQRPFRSGSAAVDRVVEVVGAGIRGAREMRRQWGWGGDC
ncbi:uncharacterized protein PV09_01166 [Verruconis gallopava]|uniref:Uncharacterized protein n=1 Tax=Verruconis gallopava TaxID=253628 RepID=A0A0D2AND1_9PEZI|nr:uncharacterized protein PV09_01166 [Verruconis gallopava]KIW08238.1 hypothetical protein PV09_01166 [Verruconis gallopava]